MDRLGKAVLLIDDHSMFRAGLRSALQVRRLELRVLEASSVLAALDLLATRPPLQLIVYDWKLGRGDGGRRGLLALTEGAPGVPVLVLSAFDDEEIRLAAESAGAVEYLLKSADARELCAAIRRWIDRDGEGGVPAVRGVHPVLPPLTPRQFDVLRAMARGMENKLIAADLRITQATVRGHVSDILRLFKARNRTQAVVMAARGGLV